MHDNMLAAKQTRLDFAGLRRLRSHSPGSMGRHYKAVKDKWLGFAGG